MRPPRSTPKRNTILIVVEDEDMTLLNARTLQSTEAMIHELATNRTTTRLRMHRQMMDVTTPAIMAAKNRADHRPTGRRDETHSRIPAQVGLDARWRICLAQTDTLALLP